MHAVFIKSCASFGLPKEYVAPKIPPHTLKFTPVLSQRNRVVFLECIDLFPYSLLCRWTGCLLHQECIGLASISLPSFVFMFFPMPLFAFLCCISKILANYLKVFFGMRQGVNKQTPFLFFSTAPTHRRLDSTYASIIVKTFWLVSLPLFSPLINVGFLFFNIVFITLPSCSKSAVAW